MADDIKYCYAIQYDKETGDIRHITMFSDHSEEAVRRMASDHYADCCKPGNDYAEITRDEFEQAHGAKKIDKSKVTRWLNKREKQEVTINEHGVSWKEERPAPILKKQEV